MNRVHGLTLRRKLIQMILMTLMFGVLEGGYVVNPGDGQQLSSYRTVLIVKILRNHFLPKMLYFALILQCDFLLLYLKLKILKIWS